MPQSLSKVYLHCVWSTKGRKPSILPEYEDQLYAYIGGIIKELGGIPIQINGMPDHIHVLTIFPRTITIAKFLEQIKGSSSLWVKTLDPRFSGFTWQRGYAVFSVSKSELDQAALYILNQKSHHNFRYYKEELLQLLQQYEVEFQEEYLWD